ncbi:hypothetical protein PEC18_34985 [Paucibacter sp. O1-1]|nr:hypothetical protein [Paucibacter sp. O1-1]MDA3830882.1 hypothetical protein [Paucibacter sp. O1-1]
MGLGLVSGFAVAGPVATRITTTSLTLPGAAAAAGTSFCLGGYCGNFSPRLYLAPRADGSYWPRWTGSNGAGRVSRISAGGIASTFSYVGEEVRGLVAHDDGGFAVLLRKTADNSIRLTRRSASDVQQFSTAITNPNAIAQMNTGDARLAYGNSRYAAYFAVHGVAGNFNGHEGDQLAYISSAGAPMSGGWTWGCSHQMAGLMGYHPGLNSFNALCMSDCYNSKGILVNDSRNLFPVDAGCNGTVWGQFGQMAAAATTWKLAFVAQNRPGYPAQGVGFLSFDNNTATAPVLKWLTATDGTTERDPVLARIGTTTPERFLVGWRSTADSGFRLGVVDGAGTFVTPLETVPGIAWGNRDDSLQSAPNGKVAWVSVTPNSTALKLYEYAETSEVIFANGFQ